MSKLIPRRPQRQTGPNADGPSNPQATKLAEEYDEPGTELGKDARVWRVYVQETDQVDKDMCDDWDKSLDVILIFAALFSAISTAFILESMKKLQPDPADTSAATLLDISRTLAALSNGQAVPMPSAPDPTSTPFIPSRASILVNTLWLVSLMISVGVSLMAMLAKKWCHRFLSARSGPYHEQARRRQKRWNSILSWRMQGAMDGLPLLMHLALALFATGLSVYLWDINQQVAAPVVAITSVFVILYAAATFLPVMFDSCPYGTALSDAFKSFIIPSVQWILSGLGFSASYLLKNVCKRLRDLLLAINWDYLGKKADSVADMFEKWYYVLREIHRLYSRNNQRNKSSDDEFPMDIITSCILDWLISNSEDREHVSVALQAISGATVDLPMTLLRKPGIEAQLYGHLLRFFSGSWYADDLHLKPDAKLTLASPYLRALSHVLVSDSTDGFHDDAWSKRGKLGSFTTAKMLMATYRVIAQNYPDSTNSPNAFILDASAMMPICHINAYSMSESEVALFTDNIASGMLGVVRRHNDKNIKLSVQALTAFAAGCAHYLVWKISKGTVDDTVQQLIVALLRIYLAPDELSIALKHTIAVTLAASTAATEPNHSEYGISETDNVPKWDLPSVRLLQHNIHQGATGSRGHPYVAMKLFNFGAVGVLPLLQFNLLSTEDIKFIRDDFHAFLLRCNFDSISIRGIQRPLSYPGLGERTALKLLRSIPNTGKSLEAESAIKSCLQGILTISYGSDTITIANSTQVDSLTVLGLCHARAEELWDYGLRFLGIALDSRLSFDDSSSQLLARYELSARLFEVSLASDRLCSPIAMQRLWRVVQRILASTNSSPNVRLSALGSLLRHDKIVEIKSSFGGQGLPNSIDDMQFGRIWHEQLFPIISSGPVLDLDGGIISIMLQHYGSVAPTQASSKEFSVTHDMTDLLDKWKNLDDIYKSRRQAQKQWKMLRGVVRTVCCLSYSRIASKRMLYVVSAPSEPTYAGPNVPGVRG